jgi:hypothetical protein
MRATAILALGAATCLKVTTADCDAITLADVRSSPGFPTGADAAACAITAAAPSCTLSACAAGYSATAVGGEATVYCDSTSGAAVLTLVQGTVALGCVEVEQFVCPE